jgi:hypothetical protein
MQAFATSNTAFGYSTAPLTIGGGRAFVIAGNSNTAGLTGIAGSDDTSSAVGAETGAAPKTYIREMTIVSTLDATWTISYDGTVRIAAIGLVVTGIASIPTIGTNSGAGASLPSHSSFAVTGGPRNVLVVDAMTILGAHVTNPPVAPSGHTLLDVVGPAGTNAPTDNNRPTVAAAQRTYAAGDLSWTGGNATIPAATWQGLADIGTQAWSTVRLVLLS